MQTDAYFAIGCSHECCQDYAISGQIGNDGYAIVCDGCSSSRDVDFGARALAHAARLHFNEFHWPYGDFGKAIAVRAWDSVQHLGMSWTALHSTLLYAVCDAAGLKVRIYGDGVVVLSKGSDWMTIHVEYVSGAPNYLAYGLPEAARDQALYREVANEPVVVTIYGNDTRQTEQRTIDDPLEWNFPAGQWDRISVISDGMNTFHVPGGSFMGWLDMVPEFTSFKNINGVFVKRRMNALARKCRKDQVVHEDDISISSIALV